MVKYIYKLKKKIIIILSLLALLLIGYSLSNIFENKKSVIAESAQDKLILSLFSADNKGSMLSLDVNSKTENYLITDKQVAITGDLSLDDSKVMYADALNESDPWQIYSYNVADGKNIQLTDTKFGKSHVKVSQDDSVYFLTSSNGKVKVAKINTETKLQETIDSENLDREVDAFDIKDNKLILSTDSSSLRLKNWSENNGKQKPMSHTIFQVDPNGDNLKEIATVKASLIESISYTSNVKKVIIGGSDINDDSGFGIYELSLDTGTITTILTDKNLASIDESIVSEIAHPVLAKMSKDESLIYFAGIPKDSKKVTIAEMSCYPTAIFSYNISTKELKEVFNPKVPSLIFDMNIKY